MNGGMLSPYLAEVEFLTTQHRDLIPEQQRIWLNTPALQENGRRFANTTFEEVRAVLGVPLHVNSGYRCPTLNAAIPNANPHSYHMRALAADIVPIGLDLDAAMKMIAAGLDDRRITDLDKAIIECGTWIHIQAALGGMAPRLLALKSDDGVNFTRYT